MTNTLFRRGLTAAMTLAVSAGLFVALPAVPAVAAGCNGSSSQSSVWGNCAGSGTGTVIVDPTPGVDWHVTRYLDPIGSCVDSRNNPSQHVDMWAIVNGRRQVQNNFCITQWTLTTGVPTQQEAELAVPVPEISSDFSGSFLTGAPIKFTLEEPGTLVREIEGFDASVSAVPATYVWDFGDGTTSNEATPTHVYRSKTINGGNVARVTVTVTYNATLSQNAADGTPIEQEDLAPIEVTNVIERPIVEVWSALTEAR